MKPARRWYLALESQRMGWGADQLLMQITGVDEKTIRRGREELAASLVNRPVERIRRYHLRSAQYIPEMEHTLIRARTPVQAH